MVLVLPKAESDCCKVNFNTTEENEEDIEEATANLAGAKKISRDVFPEVDVTVTFKEEQRRLFSAPHWPEQEFR